MTLAQQIFEVLKYLLPALVVFLTAWLLIKEFLGRVQSPTESMAAAPRAMPEAIANARMKAYERLALFLERTAVDSLISRVRKTSMTATELQIAMVATIRKEYEHNLSQQVYVSDTLWMMIKASKEETISLINRIGSSLPSTATGLELSRALLNSVIRSQENSPNQSALNQLNVEAKSFLD